MAKKKTIKGGDNWDYSPSLESTSHITILPKYELFINNEWVKPSSKKYFKTTNPSNEEVLSEIAWANDYDVDLAVKAARNAYNDVWSKTSPKERSKYI